MSKIFQSGGLETLEVLSLNRYSYKRLQIEMHEKITITHSTDNIES